jgi:hypothetical protein
VTVEPRPTSLFGDREVALVDLLDRLLAGGVVLSGDVTISLAGVDLVRISLRALITSIAPADPGPTVAVRSERVAE